MHVPARLRRLVLHAQRVREPSGSDKLLPVEIASAVTFPTTFPVNSTSPGDRAHNTDPLRRFDAFAKADPSLQAGAPKA